MFEDPIVNEIREIRKKLAAEYNYDIHAMFAHWREMEKNHPERVVHIIRNSEPMHSIDSETIFNS